MPSANVTVLVGPLLQWPGELEVGPPGDGLQQFGADDAWAEIQSLVAELKHAPQVDRASDPTSAAR
jgi:hypothetical protein